MSKTVIDVTAYGNASHVGSTRFTVCISDATGSVPAFDVVMSAWGAARECDYFDTKENFRGLSRPLSTSSLPNICEGVSSNNRPAADARLDLTQGLTRDLVVLFFALVEQLACRPLSDDDRVCRLEKDRRYTEAMRVRNEAYHYILHMHRLAHFFMCTIAKNWVERSLFSILNDESARATLEYALDNTGTEVYPEARQLYATALVWARCYRDPVISPLEAPSNAPDASLDTYVSWLRARVTNHEELDISIEQNVYRLKCGAFVMRGAVRKCLYCFDSETPIAGSSVVHGWGNAETMPEHGMWYITLNEERCASGRRTMTINRTPWEVIKACPIPVAGQPDNIVLRVMEWLNQRREHYPMTSVSPNTQRAQSTYHGELELRFVSRATVRKNFMKNPLHHTFTMSCNSAVPVTQTSMPLPIHWRELEYYVGTCSRCKKRRPIATVLYKLSVKQETAVFPG